jgi:adenylate cyclase
MAARATVEVIEGGTSRVVAVPREGISIGRAAKGGLVLSSRSVSSKHAELFWQGDDLFVRDSGSSFGTRRDGQEIKHPERLSDGDEIVLGGSAILRVSIFGAGFGAPLSELSDLEDDLIPTEAEEGDARSFSIDLLPIAESLYQATTFDDLGHRITRAVFEHFRPSRVVLLEIEGASARYRVLGTAGVAMADATFVSRTIVSEASRRGVAHYREGTREHPLASVVRSGASAVIAAGIRPRDGRVRVLYMDVLFNVSPLTWSHALSLQLFAAHAAGAFDALAARLVMAEEQRRFERLRRYFSPAVVEHILKSQLDVLERPQNLDATVLFADLVGYTNLSERLRSEPERLMDLLNRWLDAGARAVIAQGGTLDKFIGDAVMAVFGAPLPVQSGELLAVRCAIEMRDSIADIAKDAAEELAITVGINSGSVLAGSVGSKRRLEYTVLGDTVNVASRLQGQAKAGEILVGKETAARLADLVELEDAGELELKNHRAVRAFRVIRLKD